MAFIPVSRIQGKGGKLTFFLEGGGCVFTPKKKKKSMQAFLFLAFFCVPDK